MSTPFMIRRTRWDSYVDALAAGQRWWSEEQPTQPAGAGGRAQESDAQGDTTNPTPGDTTRRHRRRRPRQRLRPPRRVRWIDYAELLRAAAENCHADGTLTDEEFAAKAEAVGKLLGPRDRGNAIACA